MKAESYSDAHVQAVKDFNRRMTEGGAPQGIAESPIPKWLPAQAGMPLYQEYFVVLDDRGVHGGYILKHQPFWLNGESAQVADYRFPLSEGIVNSRYGLVGLLTVKDAMRRQPLSFGLGMGSRSEAVARLLKIVKWKMVDCPFFFYVNRPFRFLRGIAHLRRRTERRLALDLLAFSGLGWLGLKCVQGFRAFRPSGTSGTTIEEVDVFGSWSDDVWDRAKKAYRFIAVRDRAMLDRLYPASDERFSRILVQRAGEAIGWAVMLDTTMKEHKQFGNLRIGSIVDCLAVPGTERAVVAAATLFLRRRKVDMIVSNQLHRDWCDAFGSCGYLAGPSNFLFAAAPELERQLDPFEEVSRLVHMTRGDGDGPINL